MNASEIVGREWITKKEAAFLGGYSEKTIQRAISRKEIETARNGVRRVRISRKSFDRWMGRK